jgi:formiminotetrahydrofolate cyclodeaminase
MAARFSGSRFDTPEAIVEQLEAARATALSLAAADERAVESVFGSGRPEASAEELLQLVEVPGAIAHLAAELRPVLVTIADEGNPVVRGDAITGAELAGAAGRAALALLRLNADQMDEAQRSTVLDNATAIEPRLI